MGDLHYNLHPEINFSECRPSTTPNLRNMCWLHVERRLAP